MSRQSGPEVQRLEETYREVAFPVEHMSMEDVGSSKPRTYHLVPSGASGAGKTTVEGKAKDPAVQVLTSIWVGVLPRSEACLCLSEDLSERTRVMDVPVGVEEVVRDQVRDSAFTQHHNECAPVALKLCPDRKGTGSPEVPLDDPV